MADIFGVVSEMGGAFFRNEIEAGSDDELVLVQRNVCADDVQRLRNLADGLVVGLEDVERIVARSVNLPINGPAAFVVVQERDIGDDARVPKRTLNLCEFGCRLRDFGENRFRLTVRADESAVHFLLAI